MWTLFRIVLFIIGIAIVFFFIEFRLYNLGVLFWFIPLIGLALMGINPFGPSTTKQENNEVERRVINNLDSSEFTTLNNPQGDIKLVKDFIDETNDFTSLIFVYDGVKQIVNGISLKNDKLHTFNLIENRRKIYELNGIQQLKRVNGYKYSFEKTKLCQDFVQIRDYFKRYLTVNDSYFIRFRGGDNSNDIYSWKLTDNLITNFNNIGEGEKHFYRYITLPQRFRE